MSTLHVVSHTHWDREWYMPFEAHRLRLVALVDLLLDIFATDPAFRHFHMDGQMIPYEDYLEVRPGREPELRAAVEAGKLSVGPWYVLQDEFLTSGEANVRNMMAGLKLARQWGAPCMVGYLPDAFGNLSQMPQILRGFGIDNAVFGRGLNAYNPARAEDPDAEPGEIGYKSEVTWRAPDGSEVLGVFMANWYSNAMDIPSDPAQAAEFLARARDNALRFATTDQLLLMNGCDHTPTRSDVGRVLETVAGLLPDTVTHTTLDSYIAALRDAVGELQVVTGELRGDHTDGWGTLADTLSTRMYQKQMNWQAQRLLERWAEPLCAVASVLGEAHPTDALWYAWATLMKNHPHDSVCGCSCDEVHQEMDLRYDKAQQVGRALRDTAAQAIGDRVDNGFAGEGTATVLVFNPLGTEASGCVDVDVEFPEGESVRGVVVQDEHGVSLPALLDDPEGGWGYKLPDDRFRTPYGCTRVGARVFVPDVPPLGYRTLKVAPKRRRTEPLSHHWDGALNNEYMRAEVTDDGSLDITELKTGFTFRGLNLLEDGGDCGDEYIYRAPTRDKIVRAGKRDAWRVVAADTDDLGTWVLLQYVLDLPVSSDSRRRSPETRPVPVVARLFLGNASRGLEVKVSLLNGCTDHRLRALFPTDIEAETCSADGQFDIVQRKIHPWSGWRNPSNPQPQQAFVDISDGEKGLCIANRGLPCYEVLRDGRNTIALTLLRCVGQLGDWGVFPTPEAQCLGEHTAEYAIIPHAGNIMDPENCAAARAAYEFANPLWATQVKHFMHPHRERWTNALPPTSSFLSLEPVWLVLSAVKKAEDRASLIVRFYNPFEKHMSARLTCPWGVREAYLTNLAEERQEALTVSDGVVEVEAGAKQIVTVELVV